jgi:hypothetical protein
MHGVAEAACPAARLLRALQGSCRSLRIYDIRPDQFQPRCRPYCLDYW